MKVEKLTDFEIVFSDLLKRVPNLTPIQLREYCTKIQQSNTDKSMSVDDVADALLISIHALASIIGKSKGVEFNHNAEVFDISKFRKH